MSIHPVYARAILQGEKLVEFRRRPLARNVSHVLVYATKPVGRIVGAFSISGQRTTSPERLWHAYSGCAGIPFSSFSEYFRDVEQGTGIGIGHVFEAPSELPLDATLGISRPPQSFQYVDVNKARALIAEMHLVSGAECRDPGVSPRQLMLGA